MHCRPSSTRLPATTFSLTTPDAPDIARVTLVKAGSATHSFDMDQRFVEPVFTISGNQVNIELPANQYERLGLLHGLHRQPRWCTVQGQDDPDQSRNLRPGVSSYRGCILE